MGNRKTEGENLTFSRAQVYLILGCIVTIAVLSFIIGRLGGGDGGVVRNENAQLQQNHLLSESEVLEEMNRLEKRLEKAAEVLPTEEPALTAKPHESAEGSTLSFAKKLSGGAPAEGEVHEIKVKTIEKIERLTIVPTDKGTEINLNKRAIKANVVRGKESTKKAMPKQPATADIKQPAADVKRPVAQEASVALSSAQVSLKKPEPKIANPKYTIQVGSFPSEKSAKKLQIRLKNKGYGSYIKKVSRLRAVWYRVCVGAFEKRREAEKILDRLKSKERLEGIILNYKKTLL